VNPYEQAIRRVSPLQSRVYGATATEPRTVAEIVHATGVVDTASKSHRTRRLDPMTTRNALSFLAAKGMVAVDRDGHWRRTGMQLDQPATPRRAVPKRFLPGRVPAIPMQP
jgi:hypothetical protein